MVCESIRSYYRQNTYYLTVYFQAMAVCFQSGPYTFQDRILSRTVYFTTVHFRPSSPKYNRLPSMRRTKISDTSVRRPCGRVDGRPRPRMSDSDSFQQRKIQEFFIAMYLVLGKWCGFFVHK